MSQQASSMRRILLKREPRIFIAREVIDFLDIGILDENECVPRKADLRAFVTLMKERSKRRL